MVITQSVVLKKIDFANATLARGHLGPSNYVYVELMCKNTLAQVKNLQHNVEGNFENVMNWILSFKQHLL